MDGSGRTSRTSLQIMLDTIFALMMRELKTRFGAKKLGYFWAIIEPAAQASIMAIMFSLIGRSSLSGVPVALFMISGIMPFKFFSKLLLQLSGSVQANKALFTYRQVSILDPLITRLIIEVVTYIVVFCIILAAMAWMGFNVEMQDFLAFLMVNLLLISLGFGVGILLCVASAYWEDTTKVVGMVMMPMYIMSGIFFTATIIPQKYLYIFDWNPIFHIIELIRQSMFVSYTSPVGDWQYVAFCALVANAAGLMLYQVNRQRFITS
ncbi:Putative capsule transport protein KpsM, ABC transmembrane type-2 [Oleispira antarctica RB-8]|uniref:Transport permease protein n=1 Tax=Oleispira antarctica RB-8 TaxID=698738 RepID=R4YMP4_OLEAN|nr:Putative capsule transport protein KpsM, ABC transmembrane type-2 [Oleispira antarctica RB-8]